MLRKNGTDPTTRSDARSRSTFFRLCVLEEGGKGVFTANAAAATTDALATLERGVCAHRSCGRVERRIPSQTAVDP